MTKNNKDLIQVSEQGINEIANNIDIMSSVTEMARIIAGEMGITNDIYTDTRIRAFEGIFTLLTSKLVELDNQLLDLMHTEYEVKEVVK